MESSSDEHKFAIVLFGPPGSGKGTQAERIARDFSLEHIDSGKLIEHTVHDSLRQDDAVIQEQRKLFDSGVLNDPTWVVNLILEEMTRTANAGRGIIFSGSPRTLFEAEREIPRLEELYGRESIFFLQLCVSSETSLFRNTHRRVCKGCGRSIRFSKETELMSRCEECGGEIAVRSLDNPDAIQVRLREYENRTTPIFGFLKERGFTVIEINGEPEPDVVAGEIREYLKIHF